MLSWNNVRNCCLFIIRTLIWSKRLKWHGKNQSDKSICTPFFTFRRLTSDLKYIFLPSVFYLFFANTGEATKMPSKFSLCFYTFFCQNSFNHGPIRLTLSANRHGLASTYVPVESIISRTFPGAYICRKMVSTLLPFKAHCLSNL